MNTLRIVFSAAALVLIVWSFSDAGLAQNQVEGKRHGYLAMCNSPGLCVVEVHPRVSRFVVECEEPGFEAVIWEGLPSAGDYIDTLGCDRVAVQAFYSFPPGEHQLVGFGVIAKHAEYPPTWTKQQRLRTTNTIRLPNPDWDFTFRDRGMSFDPCLRRANEANYRVTAKWGGPRYNTAPCKAAEGSWKWFNGGETRLHGDGTVKYFDRNQKETNNGTWRCSKGSTTAIEILWAKGGWRDALTLTNNGQRLEGKNQFNTAVWGERTRIWQLADCPAVEGRWKWFSGGTVVIDSRGGVIGYDNGGKEGSRGTWRCVNGSPVTIEISWVRGGWRDTLALTNNGQRLEGKNQFNARVWGERMR